MRGLQSESEREGAGERERERERERDRETERQRQRDRERGRERRMKNVERPATTRKETSKKETLLYMKRFPRLASPKLARQGVKSWVYPARKNSLTEIYQRTIKC